MRLLLFAGGGVWKRNTSCGQSRDEVNQFTRANINPTAISDASAGFHASWHSLCSLQVRRRSAGASGPTHWLESYLAEPGVIRLLDRKERNPMRRSPVTPVGRIGLATWASLFIP
jgi:hypothetical protein